MICTFNQEQQFAKMSFELKDCPICFDVIGEKNSIVTECGHNFHASCLMTNITRNGFGCPCCRAVMADERTEIDTMSNTEIDDDETDDDETDDEDANDALRGLRLFNNRIEGVEHDYQDLHDEFSYIEGSDDVIVPSVQEFTNLLRIKGVTYEQLVANAMLDQDEYCKNDYRYADLDDRTGDLWEIARTYINEYSYGIVDVEDRPAEDRPAEDRPAEDRPAEDRIDAVSPIPMEETSDCSFSEVSGFIMEERRELRFDNLLHFIDLVEIRMDLAKRMAEVDYKAQPKMPMIHV